MKFVTSIVSVLSSIMLMGCASASTLDSIVPFAEDLGRDLVGNEVIDGFVICPELDIDQTIDVMRLVFNNPSEDSVDVILRGNQCRMVTNENDHRPYRIVKFDTVLIDRREPTDEYPTSYWFSFLAIDGTGKQISAFVGVDTD